jgi:antitoxin VapB
VDKHDRLNEERRAFNLRRVFGAAPRLKTIDKERHRTKVFKSGNSLAVRIPAGTKLSAGMEMDLVVEDGQFLSYEPVEQPRRKFNIAKVAGSATSLKRIEPEDRLFAERSLRWGQSPSDDEA